jgi:Ser/Thr protein kinase RdoA (MazF antagonist)
MARPTSGDRMLDPLPGTEGAKARLAAIVATMSGEKSIPAVCEELGIGEARFHEMRKEFLASAVELLEKKTAGRKPAGGESPERIRELEKEVRKLRVELEASRLRTEIALTMPNLLKRRAGAGEGIGSLGGKVKKKKRRR